MNRKAGAQGYLSLSVSVHLGQSSFNSHFLSRLSGTDAIFICQMKLRSMDPTMELLSGSSQIHVYLQASCCVSKAR